MFKRLKDQRGLTLIELLVVVVILGIIAAIAVPSVGGLIDNSKKDAHVANAQQMINSARIYLTGNANSLTFDGNTEEVLLMDLITGGYIDAPVDPDTGKVAMNADGNAINDTGGVSPNFGYNHTTSKVVITKSGNEFSYSVVLIGKERRVATAAGGTTPVNQVNLGRGSVVSNTAVGG